MSEPRCWLPRHCGRQHARLAPAPQLLRTQNHVEAELGFHDLRYFADFQSESGVGEGGPHQRAIEFAQITAAIGGAGFVRVLLDERHEVFARSSPLLRFLGSLSGLFLGATDAW